ncbi:hypothetical protein AAFF_G00123170 [Aldrovandia affinis]|uniref:Uncharacterized protein n=1 Tax=Aldrovandia affinis TaxID=143900 RepID=A0AAD7W9Q0_9TELE|nr:hypothetical protein AAFF_G00123170 [Aldrovandia affinis]
MADEVVQPLNKELPVHIPLGMGPIKSVGGAVLGLGNAGEAPGHPLPGPLLVTKARLVAVEEEMGLLLKTVFQGGGLKNKTK